MVCVVLGQHRCGGIVHEHLGRRRGPHGDRGVRRPGRLSQKRTAGARTRPLRRAPGAATSSPREAAYWRRSSSCSGVRSVGVATSTWTKRSPRPRPRRCGTPRPRMRSTCPFWVPGADDERWGPSSDSTSVSTPSAACARLDRQGRVEVVALALEARVGRRRRGGRTATRSARPAGPRRRVRPAGASSRARRPPGTSTVKVFSSIRRPSPRQSGHGCGIMSPVPAHREQATLVTTCPSSDWRTRRSSPVPWQSVHVSGSVPGAVPRAGACGAHRRQAHRDVLAGSRTRPPRTPGRAAPRRRRRGPGPAAGRLPRHLAEERLEDVAEAALEVEAAIAAGLRRRRRPRARSGRSWPGAPGRAAPRRRRSPA